MATPRFSLIAFSILTLASIALSQPVSRRPVPIEPLLRSSDPRLVALGAWEVLRRREDSFLPLLVSLVEQWDPAQRHRDDSDRFDAMTAILDVLIQRDAVLSSAAVTAIASAFPDQALILAARLPDSEAEPLLLAWYEDGRQVPASTDEAERATLLLRSRVAALMLAREHPQDIAAAILADSMERLVVSVPSAGASGVDRCLVDCQDPPACVETAAEPPQPGWPHIFQYHLKEYRADETNPNPQLGSRLLIEAGGDFITYERVEAGFDANYCHSPMTLSAPTRNHLIAQMLGMSYRQMPWTAQMNLTLPWVSDSQFKSELASQIGLEEARLRVTMQQFFSKGLITKSQMETIRPKLSVTLFDDRAPAQPANPELPLVASKDPRTTCLRRPRR